MQKLVFSRPRSYSKICLIVEFCYGVAFIYIWVHMAKKEILHLRYHKVLLIILKFKLRFNWFAVFYDKINNKFFHDLS